jgi:hypothetical protein
MFINDVVHKVYIHEPKIAGGTGEYVVVDVYGTRDGFIIHNATVTSFNVEDGVLYVAAPSNTSSSSITVTKPYALTHVSVHGRVHCTLHAHVYFSTAMATLKVMNGATMRVHASVTPLTLHVYVTNAGAVTFDAAGCICETCVLYINQSGSIVNVRCRGLSTLQTYGTGVIRMGKPPCLG